MGNDRRFTDVQYRVLGTANDSASTRAGDQFIVGATPTGNFANFLPGWIAQRFASGWRGLPPQVNGPEIGNDEIQYFQYWDGTAWQNWIPYGSAEGKSPYFPDPVLDIVGTGATLPPTAAVGDKFLNTTDGKLYTATAANTWDAGVVTANGDRYGSSTDGKIYTKDADAFTSETPPDGAAFIAKEEDLMYAYDGATGTLKGVGVGQISDAGYNVKGVVSVGSGIKVVSGQISVDRESGPWPYTLVAADVTAKGFAFATAIGKPYVMGRQVSVSVMGVTQYQGTDFEVVADVGGNGPGISWTGKTLDVVGLAAGDLFNVGYDSDPAHV